MVKEIGNCNDVRCRQNSIKRVLKKSCRNNCKYCVPTLVQGKKRKYIKKVCSLGYWYNEELKQVKVD